MTKKEVLKRARTKNHPAKGLTSYQKKFTELYSGNGTKAAIQAGYSKKTAYSIASELLKKPEIIKAIQEREKKELAPLIADRQERQRFWTEVLRKAIKRAGIKMDHRLKASELLGKSEADFTENIAHLGIENLAEKIKKARQRRKQCEKTPPKK